MRASYPGARGSEWTKLSMIHNSYIPALDSKLSMREVIVYRTQDKGKTWAKCSLEIPDSFKSIATYATALSPVFNGVDGVLPVTFRNNNWRGNPVDVTVRYQTVMLVSGLQTKKSEHCRFWAMMRRRPFPSSREIMHRR